MARHEDLRRHLEVVAQSEVRDIGVGNKASNALVQVAKYVDSSNHNDDFEASTQFRCTGWSTDLRLDEGRLVDSLERIFEVEAE